MKTYEWLPFICLFLGLLSLIEYPEGFFYILVPGLVVWITMKIIECIYEEKR